MADCSPLCWLAVFYRKGFYRKLFTVARYSGKLHHYQLGGDWPIILIYTTYFNYSHFLFTYALTLTWMPSSHLLQLSIFHPFLLLLPLAFSTAGIRGVLNFPYHLTQVSYISLHLIVSPELSWERKGKEQQKSIVRLLLYLLFLISDNFPQIHL